MEKTDRKATSATIAGDGLALETAATMLVKVLGDCPAGTDLMEPWENPAGDCAYVCGEIPDVDTQMSTCWIRYWRHKAGAQ